MEPLMDFYRLWPRNFAIAFVVESLIAQPLASSLPPVTIVGLIYAQAHS